MQVHTHTDSNLWPTSDTSRDLPFANQRPRHRIDSHRDRSFTKHMTAFNGHVVRRWSSTLAHVRPRGHINTAPQNSVITFLFYSLKDWFIVNHISFNNWSELYVSSTKQLQWRQFLLDQIILTDLHVGIWDVFHMALCARNYQSN